MMTAMVSVVDISNINRGNVSITSKFLPSGSIAALREDARALLKAGAFVSGELKIDRKRRRHEESKSTTIDKRTRVCEVCGIFDDAENVDISVGDRDARDELLDVVSDLRELLINKLGIELSESMELQYLHYPGSTNNNESDCAKNNGTHKEEGFYRRHFDHTGDEDGPFIRKVSLLLYLNDDGWDSSTDGGILRAYVRPTMKSKRDGSCDDVNGDSQTIDIVPEGGKLVLFDSSAVEHEVFTTKKERWAVVGWFLMDRRIEGKMKKKRVRAHHRSNGASNRSTSKKGRTR
jgi:hypothetical protein